MDHTTALREAASLGPVVDVACGRGRNARAVARQGIPVLGLDRNEAHLAELRASARNESLPIRAARSDLESGAGLPLRPGRCGVLMVFRFLHRPLAPELCAALAPGGLLFYETFTIHQRELGYGPKRDAFLLVPGELPELFAELEPLHHWEGRTSGDRPAAVAQLIARRPG